METIQVTKDAMDALFSNLDEAIDDIKNARIISEEEMWTDLDAIYDSSC